MKFALVNDERIEASKGAKGVCPSCGSELIAKCGEIVIHHWAHKKKCSDNWWENETEWHRNWKNQFSNELQEVIQYDESGEKHIADVKTDEGWVVEFQHSHIKPEERRSRNNFYKKLIWVVDGTRLKKDIERFKGILGAVHLDKPSQSFLYVLHPETSRLLKEWIGADSMIFLDFKDNISSNQDLWLMYPKMYEDGVYLSMVSRSTFIEYLTNNKFDEIIDKVINPIRITIEHSIKKNEERNDSLRPGGWFGKMHSLPESYLGNLKLPYGILSKIDILGSTYYLSKKNYK